MDVKEQLLPALLIVDDEPSVLDLYRRALPTEYEIITAASGEAGLEWLKTRSFCAIVTDQHLPGMDGLALLTQAQTLWPDAGRVLITGYATQGAALAAINAGVVTSFLSKPFDTTELAVMLKREVHVALLRSRLRTEHQQYYSLLHDDRHDLPTRHMMQNQAIEWLISAGSLSLLVIDAAELWERQNEVGTAEFIEVEQRFVATLKEMHGRFFRVSDVLTIDEVRSSTFCVFLSPSRDNAPNSVADVAAIAVRLQDFITATALDLSSVGPYYAYPRVAVGAGFVIHNPYVSPLYQLRKVLGDARSNALERRGFDPAVSHKSTLQRIILTNQLHTAFQPIRDLKTLELLGYEALGRGPAGTPFNSPEVLLEIAERNALSFELDRAFREATLKRVHLLPPDSRVFVNVLPSTLHDPDLRGARFEQLLNAFNIAPRRLIFEFSERYAVRNIEVLLQIIAELRERGIELALDDVGAGYSGLERIATLRPNYIKIDRSLVAQIDSIAVKRAIVAATAKMAADIDAIAIAEGIETQAELDCLADLGIVYGQGYYLDLPAILDKPV